MKTNIDQNVLLKIMQRNKQFFQFADHFQDREYRIEVGKKIFDENYFVVACKHGVARYVLGDDFVIGDYVMKLNNEK